MAKYTEDTNMNTDFHQQMLAHNPTPEVDRQGMQRYTLKNENDQATTHRKLNKEEKMEVDRTHSGNLQKPSSVKPSGKEIQRGKQKRWVTPGERLRGWPRTDNSGVPWSMAYAPSEQTGICM